MKFRVLSDLTPSDPYENLAVEEALSNVKITSPIIRFWVNVPSVILGMFDRVEDEVNLDYCIDNEVIIARRHTGGGTVYHDEGNLNISLIIPKTTYLDLGTCYRVLGSLLIQAINSFGVRVDYVDSNALMINRKKVSGMAGSLTKYSLLCHSTFLVNSDLVALRNSLKRLKSDVTNLSDEVGETLKPYDIHKAVLNALRNVFNTDLITDSLGSHEATFARKLYLSKYSRDYWIYRA
ncbi:MAG: lipoate--protein ligase family protein [Sulfolobales archaeon]|nr:lipoate--protein ligase family protein [Sulfolobales archaeon]